MDAFADGDVLLMRVSIQTAVPITVQIQTCNLMEQMGTVDKMSCFIFLLSLFLMLGGFIYERWIITSRVKSSPYVMNWNDDIIKPMLGS